MVFQHWPTEVSSFDLVVTDLSMSDMSGLDLLKKFVQTTKLKHIPVLMIISEDLQENIVTAIKAGLNDYVIRPFEENTFKQKLRKFCPSACLLFKKL